MVVLHTSLLHHPRLAPALTDPTKSERPTVKPFNTSIVRTTGGGSLDKHPHTTTSPLPSSNHPDKHRETLNILPKTSNTAHLAPVVTLGLSLDPGLSRKSTISLLSRPSRFIANSHLPGHLKPFPWFLRLSSPFSAVYLHHHLHLHQRHRCSSLAVAVAAYRNPTDTLCLSPLTSSTLPHSPPTTFCLLPHTVA